MYEDVSWNISKIQYGDFSDFTRTSATLENRRYIAESIRALGINLMGVRIKENESKEDET